MIAFLQFACVVVFAIGVGLLIAGMATQLPSLEGADSLTLEQYYGGQRDDVRIYPAIASGFGAGLMALGGLGLVASWVNAWLRHDRKI